MKTEVDYAKLGARIKRARRAARLSLREAAELLAIPDSNYARLERRGPRSVAQLVRVARVLDLELDVLARGLFRVARR